MMMMMMMFVLLLPAVHYDWTRLVLLLIKHHITELEK